jgi:molybdopterin/thiamine biosynthesis adenylyltransferase
MSDNRNDLIKVKSDAVKSAESELENRGFIKSNAGNEFNGTLNCNEYGSFPVRVILPENFPNALPEIFTERKALRKRIPHLEGIGRLCLIPNTGILIDASKPESIIIEALERARRLIVRGLSGENKEEFLEEFLAYWNADETLESICDANGQTRLVSLVGFIKDGKPFNLVADNLEAAQNWALKLGLKPAQRYEALFLRFNEAFYPPDFDKPVLNSEILGLIKSLCTPASLLTLNTWLWKKKLPAFLILSLPLKQNQERILIGVRFEHSEGKAKEQAQKGFRPGFTPAFREIHADRKSPVTKLSIDRLDSEYLLTRGGSTRNLLAKTVTLIGCGAIGSHLAMKLAALGVGRLRLIDNEILKAENIHRHTLGVQDIGISKVIGLAAILNRQYPHLLFEFRESRIQDLLKNEPEFVKESDLVLIALGDETLELYLNDLLPRSVKRLHTWVEPLSIGGHALVAGLATTGCYRCLFQTDPTYGIFNQAAFAALGQNFQKSFSGCAGVFTPFSAVDADKAANEAATLAARILVGKEDKNMLVSWRGYEEDFLSAGFNLSSRGKMFSAGERQIEFGFKNLTCSYCRV